MTYASCIMIIFLFKELLIFLLTFVLTFFLFVFFLFFVFSLFFFFFFFKFWFLFNIVTSIAIPVTTYRFTFLLFFSGCIFYYFFYSFSTFLRYFYLLSTKGIYKITKVITIVLWNLYEPHAKWYNTILIMVLLWNSVKLD